MFDTGTLSLMFGIAIPLAGAVGTYAVLRAKVHNLEQQISKHITHDDDVHKYENDRHEEFHKNIVTKIEATFKRIDIAQEEITILKRDTSTHLTMPVASSTFVTKESLDLKLAVISNDLKHTDKEVMNMSGKLEELITMLQGRS